MLEKTEDTITNVNPEKLTT